ncbi:hypothetical protein [Minwuia sp. IMCC3060]|uniref:hypothetical protein n=1 Tax=Minwuia sp. IMCC3060 TaxID=3040675 RepID=UPI00247A8B97|nr:hypothetical protein [Minwuia sp. IMCC3060]
MIKFPDLVFIGLNDAIILAGDDTLDQFVDLAVDACDLVFHLSLALFGVAAFSLPAIRKHGARDLQQKRSRREIAQQLFEVILDQLPADRLATPLAAALIADIVGIMLAAPL